MTEAEFEYEIIKCPKCGTANEKGLGVCRRCRAPLKVRNPLTLPLAVGGGLLLLVMCSAAAILVARNTAVGPFLALIFFIFSGILSFVGGIWLLIEGFRAGPVWGLGLIFLNPIVSIVFLFAKPDYALKPWIVNFVAIIFLVVGLLMFPDAIVDIFNQVEGAGGF